MSSHENRSPERCRNSSVKRAVALRSLRRGLAAVGASATLFAAALPAMAADSASADLTQLNSPTIYVESNGSTYTALESGGPIIGKIRVSLDTGASGRVKKWVAWPAIYFVAENGSLQSEGFQSSGRAKTYDSPRPKEVDEEFPFTITPPQYTSTVVDACNAYADQLRKQGQSSSQILGKNHWIEVAVDARLYNEMTGPEGNPIPPEVTGWSSYKKINVICRASEALDPVGQPITASYMQVDAVQTSAVRGTCELKLRGSIISAAPNTEVKFRYVDDKGQQSDVKTATTGADSNVTFQHVYPLSAGKKSGKIRIVGQSHAFFSNWDSFEGDCKTPPQNVATLLPPKAVYLEAIEKADTVMHRGLVCPAKVAIWGILKGRGAATGAVSLRVGNSIKKLQIFDIKGEEQVIVQGEHDLTWSPQSTGQQNVKYTMDVTNKQGDLVDHMDVTQNFVCRRPQVSAAGQGGPGGVVADINAPKSLTLSLSPLGLKRLPGYSCPELLRMSGNMMSGDKPLTGTVALFVNGSLVKQMPANHEPNWGKNYDTDVPLSWNAATQTEQTLIFAIKFMNQHGTVLKAVEKSQGFACQRIATNDAIGGLPGGFSNGAKPNTAQQSGDPQVGAQLALPRSYAIQSPKGMVKQGAIQLSGAQPTATYTLKFFRKSGGSATLVNAAQLPKAMKGATASFPLAALTGGRSWRLEVCPQGQAGAACETSDFRIAAFGLKQDKAQQKPQEKPEGTPFIIVPGVLN